MPTKFATLDFLEIKVISNKGYEVSTYFYDVTNKNLSKPDNSSISTKEVIITSFS